MPAYSLPDLPYDYSALEPWYSAEVLELHHGKHHAAYVKGANDTFEKLATAREKGDYTTLNMLEKNLAFHVSGHVLHSILWTNVTPDAPEKPDGQLADAIAEHFGGFDAFKSQLTGPRSACRARGGARSRGSPRAGASSSSRSTTTRATSDKRRCRCS
jgi:Fe-Mn family superoxide dismutase